MSETLLSSLPIQNIFIMDAIPSELQIPLVVLVRFERLLSVTYNSRRLLRSYVNERCAVVASSLWTRQHDTALNMLCFCAISSSPFQNQRETNKHVLH